MVCMCCGKEFSEDWRKGPPSQRKSSPRYCSYECSHSRKHSPESKQKIAQGVETYLASLSKEEKLNRPKPHFSEEAKERIKEGLAKGRALHKTKFQKRFELFLSSNRYGSLKDFGIGYRSFREYVLNEKGRVCEKCGQGELWKESFLSLHIDHIDGDAKNNSLDNLRILCPNCHSQTDTFGSKNYNKSTRDFKISRR